MNSQIEDVVSKGGLCQENRAQQQIEPMLNTEVPTLPWQYVSTDLFQFEDQWYMVTVDHYSGYIEVDLMENNHSAQVVISKLKHIYSLHMEYQKHCTQTKDLNIPARSFVNLVNSGVLLLNPTVLDILKLVVWQKKLYRSLRTC